MQFVTIEGADGAGKSTVHRGFWVQVGEDEYERQPGVVDRLASRLDRPVIPTREPGTFPIEEDWWDPPGFLDIEDHLNRTLQWMGLAWSIAPEGSQARRVLAAAGFAHKYGTLPSSVFDACKKDGGRDGTFLQEWRGLKARWHDLTTLLQSSPTMRSRFDRYGARDAIRHALIGAADSDELGKEATGLLFFAGHLLHARWLDALPDDALVISDRAGESQLAYGKAREDDPRVEELYRSERPISPDLVLVLTCEREEIAGRLGLREKEENKGWGLDTIMSAQEAYLGMPDNLDASFAFLDTTGRSEIDSIELAEEILLRNLSDEVAHQ